MSLDDIKNLPAVFKKIPWKTFLFSLAALVILWDLLRTGSLDQANFVVCFLALLILYAGKEILELVKFVKGIKNGKETVTP